MLSFSSSRGRWLRCPPLTALYQPVASPLNHLASMELGHQCCTACIPFPPRRLTAGFPRRYGKVPQNPNVADGLECSEYDFSTPELWPCWCWIPSEVSGVRLQHHPCDRATGRCHIHGCVSWTWAPCSVPSADAAAADQVLCPKAQAVWCPPLSLTARGPGHYLNTGWDAETPLGPCPARQPKMLRRSFRHSRRTLTWDGVTRQLQESVIMFKQWWNLFFLLSLFLELSSVKLMFGFAELQKKHPRLTFETNVLLTKCKLYSSEYSIYLQNLYLGFILFIFISLVWQVISSDIYLIFIIKILLCSYFQINSF